MAVSRILAALGVAASLLFPVAAPAETTITVHAGKSDSPNYAFARQFSEALALAGNGAFTMVVEESQGSIQNVMDAAKLETAYVFTTPPGIIAQARRGDKPFEKSQRYDEIRALFPIPPQALHWIARADGMIKVPTDLAGQAFIPGNKGSIGERMSAEALQAMNLDKSVRLIDADIAGAPAALKDNQIGGFALAGSFPSPAILDLAKTLPIRIIELPQAALGKIHALDDNAVAVTIPKGTYPGIDADIDTVALPAGAYTTLQMSNARAYALTKAFWTQRSDLAKKNPAWASVTSAALATLGARIHAGAQRYYKEAGIKLPANLR